MRRFFAMAIAFAAPGFIFMGCASTSDSKPIDPPATQLAPATQAATDADWKTLFDGKTLGNWKVTDFGGEGKVTIDNDSLILTQCKSFTGITWKGPLPSKMNYEIELDAQRVAGADFFCGLTFPVNNSYASLIIGGEDVCGISNLDGKDAARDDAKRQHQFKNGTWYHIRIRVAGGRIIAWIDDKKMVDVETVGQNVCPRPGVEKSEPFGIASYQTTAAIRKVRIRKVPGN